MQTAGKRKAKPLGWLGSWAPGRGDRFVVALGVGLCLLLLATVAAAALWTFHTQSRRMRHEEEQQLRRIARAMAARAGELIEQKDAFGLQGLLTDGVQAYDLLDAKIELADGRDLINWQVQQGRSPEAPEQLGTVTDVAAAERVEVTEGQISVGAVVRVDRRGEAVLRLARSAAPPMWADVRAQAGLGIICTVALASVVVMYRSARQRFRALGAIRESLQVATQFAQGELPAAGLRLSEDLGEDARAWNKLLDERDFLRQRSALDHAAQRLQQIAAGGGEFASAFDALWMGVVILDGDAKVHAVNGAAAAMLKRPKNELTGKAFAVAVSEPGIVEAVNAVVTGHSRQRVSVEVETAPTMAGTEKTILRYTVRPMRKEDASAAMIVMEDVTQQRVADESRNAFVAQATHELRTPLTNMRLYLEQLVDLGDSDPQIKARCLNVLGQETRRLERVVGDMLSVAEMEAGTFKLHTDDVRLEPLFGELEADFTAQAADKDIGLAFELPPKYPLVTGDRDKVMMALHNLVANALKYTPAGGQATVRVRDEGGKVQVDVIDNGIGIKEDEQELIFEKFYRSKDRRVAAVGGSGIGLALARQVIRLHGGDIVVKSQLDKGSTFTLTLPATAPMAQKSAA